MCSSDLETLKYEELINKTTEFLSNEKAIGWFQGRMEFGPRALGARSILADPRSSNMQKNLNLKVKYRESFRPFAPSVLREDLSEWFNLNTDSPYMLFVANVNSNKCNPMTEEQKNLFGIDKLNVKRSSIPAVTHVDYTARVQTVHKETNPRYYDLLSEFKKESGIDLKSDKLALQRLKEAAEKAKIELSSATQTEINLPFITADKTGPKHINLKMTRAKLEALVEDLISRTLPPCKTALKDAGLSAGEIDEIVLVGGMTRMPKVIEEVKNFFGKDPNKSVNPDEVVAMGEIGRAHV